MPKPKKDRIVIGITGSLACGKSTVARLFAGRSGELIDADKLAHAALSKGSAVYKKVVGFFGKSILQADGAIDRGKLAAIVFIHRPALNKLNSIVHPVVIKEIIRRIRSCRKSLVVLDAPLIIEAGLRRMVDKLVVVTAKNDQQLRRAKKSLKLTGRQADSRIKSQIPLRQKSRLADFIIDNSGNFKETRKQVSVIKKTIAGF